ncbi:hypothetical protein C8J57DRAFT_1354696, partial [Mycena rebaudengoi]
LTHAPRPVISSVLSLALWAAAQSSDVVHHSSSSTIGLLEKTSSCGQLSFKARRYFQVARLFISNSAAIQVHRP